MVDLVQFRSGACGGIFRASRMERAMDSDLTGSAGATTGPVALILRLESAAALTVALLAHALLDFGWLALGLLFLAPDLMTAGYATARRIGTVCSNAVHTHPAPPAILAVASHGGVGSLALFALAWVAHVGFDRIIVGCGARSGTPRRSVTAE
jgi:hypothetical protein